MLVEVSAKESEGLFGVTTTAVGGILGVVIVVLIALLLIRRRDSDNVVIETKHMGDYAWNDSPPSVVSEAPTSAPQQFDQDATATTCERWTYPPQDYHRVGQWSNGHTTASSIWLRCHLPQ